MALPLDFVILYAGAILAFALTLLWLGVHVFGLVRLSNSLDAISRPAQIAWAVSAIGGFMGPCVIFMSIVGMGLAVRARQAPDATPETLQATRFVLVAGAIILFMAAELVAAAGISMFLADNPL